MEPNTLLPDPSRFHLEYLASSANALTLMVNTIHSRAECPLACFSPNVQEFQEFTAYDKDCSSEPIHDAWRRNKLLQNTDVLTHAMCVLDLGTASSIKDQHSHAIP